MKKTVTILSTVLIAFFIIMTGVGQATPIQGFLLYPADSYAENPGSGPPGDDPVAAFTVNKIDFDSRRGTTTTYDTFLKGATDDSNPNGLVWTYEGIGFDKNSFYTSLGKGTYFEFYGTAFFPEKTLITHDDGFWLELGTNIYDNSTPTVPINTKLDNAAGIYEFTLAYGAWNGFPEVLIAHGVTPVPEPTSLLLLGLGLVGLTGLRRKLRK